VAANKIVVIIAGLAPQMNPFVSGLRLWGRRPFIEPLFYYYRNLCNTVELPDEEP
jgi:hypothetical protein